MSSATPLLGMAKPKQRKVRQHNWDQEQATTHMTAKCSFEDKSVTPQVPNHLHDPAIQALADSNPPLEGVH